MAHRAMVGMPGAISCGILFAVLAVIIIAAKAAMDVARAAHVARPLARGLGSLMSALAVEGYEGIWANTDRRLTKVRREP